MSPRRSALCVTFEFGAASSLILSAAPHRFALEGFRPWRKAAMEQTLETTELIKRCIAIAPFFVALIAYTLLIAVQAALL